MIEVYDEEKLKDYLEKDNSVETLLEKKIEDLNSEKQKLSDKYSELSDLEESYRAKLTHDSSTDEIRKIADEIDKIKNEVSGIKENISSLEFDIAKTTNTKVETEKTKEDYIANISKTIDEYEKKLDAINKAIEVCDNKSLIDAFNDEKSKMNIELDELKSKREQELESAINKGKIEVEENNTVKEEKLEKETENPDFNNIFDREKPIGIEDEIKIPSFDEIVVSDLNIPTDNVVKEEPTEPGFENILDSFNNEPALQANDKTKSDTLNTNNDELSDILNSLNNAQYNSEDLSYENPENVSNEIKEQDLLGDSIIMPDVNMTNTSNEENKVIDNAFVEASKISEIFESSKVMEAVYEWLSNNSNSEKVTL